MVTELRSVGGDLADAVNSVSIPSYCIDASGVIRWINPAARDLVGNVVGRQFTSVVAPEDTRRAREHFAAKVAGTRRVSDAEAVLLDKEGNRVRVDLSSVPLKDGQHHVVGVFGQLRDVDEHEPPAPPPSLTPRQVEILGHLQRGRSTHQIASDLQLSPETVRNHVRRLLRALDVHTRLEAVAVTRQYVATA